MNDDQAEVPTINMELKQSNFLKELTELINRHSMEYGSNTPDYMLAEYLNNCLASFERVTANRDKWHSLRAQWYGRSPQHLEGEKA